MARIFHRKLIQFLGFSLSVYLASWTTWYVVCMGLDFRYVPEYFLTGWTRQAGVFPGTINVFAVISTLVFVPFGLGWWALRSNRWRFVILLGFGVVLVLALYLAFVISIVRV